MSDFSEALQKAVARSILHTAEKTSDGFEITLIERTGIWPAGTIFGYDEHGEWSFTKPPKAVAQ